MPSAVSFRALAALWTLIIARARMSSRLRGQSGDARGRKWSYGEGVRSSRPDRHRVSLLLSVSKAAPACATNHAEVIRTPPGRGSLIVSAPYMVNCESLVRTYHCVRLRWGGAHWRKLKFLGYAKAMSMVPPSLWSGCTSAFRASEQTRRHCFLPLILFWRGKKASSPRMRWLHRQARDKMTS